MFSCVFFSIILLLIQEAQREAKAAQPPKDASAAKEATTQLFNLGTANAVEAPASNTGEHYYARTRLYWFIIFYYIFFFIKFLLSFLYEHCL